MGDYLKLILLFELISNFLSPLTSPEQYTSVNHTNSILHLPPTHPSINHPTMVRVAINGFGRIGRLPEVKSGVSRFLRGNLSFAFRGDVVCVLQNMSFEFFPGLYAG